MPMTSPWVRWGQLICLFAGGGVIYFLPYMRGTYYIPLMEALGVNNTQLGVMMSAYGIAAMICYFPGGLVADRFSARKLLTISFLLTGAAGLYYATFPPYPVAVALQAFWGVTTVLTYWGALIKATREWGSSVEQGRAFGILEGGRGLTGVLVSMAVLAVFASLGSGTAGLRAVVLTYSAVSLLLGIITWFVFKDTGVVRTVGTMQRVVEALKHPATWLISLIILCAYSSASASAYITPYTTAIYGKSVTFAALLALIRQWVRPVAAAGAGVIADKVGNANLVSVFFILLAGTMGVFVFVPGNPQLLWVLITNAIIMSVAIFALRGLYWALMEEGDIPPHLTGTVIGVGSAIGYTPDVFMSLLGGYFLDHYPGELGYRYLYGVLMAFAAVGLFATLYFARRYAYKRRAIVEAARAAGGRA